MKRFVSLSALVVISYSLMLVGCGGGDNDESVSLTGTWDILGIEDKSVAAMTVVQTGNTFSGTLEIVLQVNGEVSENLVTFTASIGSNTIVFTGTLSDNGNSMAGTMVYDSSTTSAFTALRRGTGEGVDMTGTWLSTDLETSDSLQMQVTQNGNTLSGVPQGATSALPGTINGSQVTFMTQVGGNPVTWTGHLSFDGNNVFGIWVNTSVPESGGWRMTRQ